MEPEATVETQYLATYVKRWDTHVVARRVDEAKGHGFFSGLRALWRLRYETWLEGKMKHQLLRQLENRADLAEGQLLAVRAQNDLKSELVAGETICVPQATPVAVTPVASIAPQPSPISPHITDRHIEGLALRAVMSLGAAPDAEKREAFTKDLQRQVPPNVAQEVERRMDQLMSLVR